MDVSKISDNRLTRKIDVHNVETKRGTVLLMLIFKCNANCH